MGEWDWKGEGKLELLHLYTSVVLKYIHESFAHVKIIFKREVRCWKKSTCEEISFLYNLC